MAEPAYPATETALPHEKNGVVYYTFPLLDRFADRLVHGFSTRLGGVSKAPFTGLNLSFTHDDRADVGIRERGGTYLPYPRPDQGDL